MSVTVKYKNNDILSIPSSGDYHLNTQGKYLEDDIRIVAEAPPPGAAIIIDTLDSAGGTIREIITDSEVYLQDSKNVIPAPTSQDIYPDSGYTAFEHVTVDAIPAGTAGTPVATKGSVSNHSISITPSVTNTSGYIEGGTKTGTAVSVSANELVSGTLTISAGGTHDVTNYASASVASGSAGTPNATKGAVSNNSISITPSVTNSTGYITGGTKTGTAVTVSASELVSGTYNVTSAGTKSVINYANISVPTGEAGTPTATKGNVSNHSISITPSVTNTAGYISGGTKTGTAVSVSASELVSGTYIVDSAGTKDVINYASASVPSGTAGTPSASKGSVNNHSITVTPSVTNTTGWITGSTKTGTGVVVSASELVSGSQTITTNSTYDVTNLASVTVSVEGGGGGTGGIASTTQTLSAVSSSISFNAAEDPNSFLIISTSDIATGAAPYKVAAVVFDGTSIHAQVITNTSNAQITYDSSTFSKTYSNGTVTVTSSSRQFQVGQYQIIYSYGSSYTVGTSDVQVGSGATSITFTGLEEEPNYFSCIFKSNFGTSSGYQRVIATRLFDDDMAGLEMDSGAHYSTQHWSYSYNNGSLTITSQGTNAGGYFHQPGYYQLTYVTGSGGGGGGGGGNYQAKTVAPSTSQQVVKPDSSYDALSQVTVTPVSQTNLTAGNIKSGTTVTISNGQSNLWSVTGTYSGGGATYQTKTVTPTTSTQYVTPSTGYDALSQVTVNPIPSEYKIPTGNIRITANGDNIDVSNYATASVAVPTGGTNFQAKTVNPSTSTQYVTPDYGYNALSQVTVNAMPAGSAGTPTATKGTVSNNRISITPSVTNTTGYITGSTKTGTAATVSASELVSGTLNITGAGTVNVTNYASASVPSGTAGTPTATKGTVSNHSINVTPSVTNTTGFITGSTKTGTAVNIKASDLVSGSTTLTANGTYDVTNLAQVVVDMSYKAGDTITFTEVALPGIVTSSTKVAAISIFVGKSLANISSITVSAFTGGLRSPNGGMVNNTSSDVNWKTQSGITITASKQEDYIITVKLSSSSAFTNVSNNMPVVMWAGTVTLSFS